MRVRPGDYVIADDDGVAVVGIERIEAVLAAAEARTEKEARMTEKLAASQTTVAPDGPERRGLAVTAAGQPPSLVERRSQAVIDGIERIDPDFVLHLASSTLKVVLGHFIAGAGCRAGRGLRDAPGRGGRGGRVRAATGRKPVLIFQDNGVGNLLTALLTFPQACHLPLFGVVVRRGGLGEYSSMIHTISERTEALLDAAGVCWFQLDSRMPLDVWAREIERAWAFSHTTHRPVFVLVNLIDG